MDPRDDAPSPATVPALDAVIAQLVASLPELSEATCTRIYDSLDAYSDIDRGRLAAAVERNMRTSIEALRSGVVPAPEALSGAALTARERHEAGLRVEEIVRGFRISIGLIHELFVDTAISGGIPVEQVVQGSRLLWAVGDSFTTRIITEYHELEVGSALRDAQRRVALVTSLLAGRRPAELGPQLDPNHRWAAVHCDVRGPARPETIRRQLETSGSTPQHRALVVLDGERCLGIVARRPFDLAVAVGLGPFVAPTDLATSDASARECLSLAQHLGRVGVQSSTELGWRLAAASRLDVWQEYHRRFVAPLAEQGDFGADVLKAVGHWLSSGMNVARTAEALSLHQNTVRYRLARFEQLTGADLADPDDQLGARWALELGTPTQL